MSCCGGGLDACAGIAPAWDASAPAILTARKPRRRSPKTLAQTEGNAMVKMLQAPRGRRADRNPFAKVRAAGLLSFLAVPLLLSACATTSEPQVRTVEVKVPVAVNCTSNIPPPSSYPDTDAALRGAANIGERVKLLMAARALRRAEILKLRASVSGCR